MNANKKILVFIFMLLALSACSVDNKSKIVRHEGLTPAGIAKFEYTNEETEIVKLITPARFPFTLENYPVVDGSTATIPLIEAVQHVLLGTPRSEITVTVSKTNGAYRALMDGDADILLVYDGGAEIRDELNADEVFETAAIGKDALVFVVNRENPISNLTTDEVQGIFSGKITNWNQLGGTNEPIAAYQRSLGSGSQALMDKLVMQGKPMADTAKVPVVESMGGLIDAVANYTGGPTGIGYNVYFYVTEMRQNDNIKILSIDGVAPSYETIQSGEYPFVSEFYSVIRASERKDSPARALHEWMLSGEAQNLMAEEHYVALKANPRIATPDIEGKYSPYPPGEEPVYMQGTNRYALEPSDAYGQLYFYLGSTHQEEHTDPKFYGLCTADGKIVTDPIYTVPILMTDLEGNRAYFCYRANEPQTSQLVHSKDWQGEEISYEISVTPAILFATDGSWVKEYDGAEPYIARTPTSNKTKSSSILAVKQDGQWGAVNLLGEVVVPFIHSRANEIYGDPNQDLYSTTEYYGLTDKLFWFTPFNPSNGEHEFALYDANRNLIAQGLPGMFPEYLAGGYVATIVRDSEVATIYVFTREGKIVATKEHNAADGISIQAVGDYLAVTDYGDGTYIYDHELNLLKKHQSIGYEFGPGILYMTDIHADLHRTYLPDGTWLVTWYDPEVDEFIESD